MLIFTKNVNWEKLKSKTRNPEEAVEYIKSLVPKWAKHIQNIENNQRYFAACYIRDVYSLPFHDRMGIARALTENISLTGMTSGFVALEDVITLCSKEDLKGALLEVYNAKAYNGGAV